MDQKNAEKPIHYDPEVIEIALTDLATTAMHVRQAAKDGESWLYYLAAPAGPGRKPPRFVKVMGLNQLERATAVAYQLRWRAKNADDAQKLTQEAVDRITKRLEQQDVDGQKLRRFDFFMMAIVGSQSWLKRLHKKGRVKLNPESSML